MLVTPWVIDEGPWDNPFHKAMYKVMEHPVSQPLHRGRIFGKGLGRKPSLYFPKSKEDRAKRKKQERTNVKTQLGKMPDIINDVVTKTVVALLLHLITAYMKWVDRGKIGPSPLTSLIDSNSLNISKLVQKNARVVVCYSVMAPEKELLAVMWICSRQSLCVVNDQPVGNPKRKV
jgi:hypothetical protein